MKFHSLSDELDVRTCLLINSRIRSIDRLIKGYQELGIESYADFHKLIDSLERFIDKGKPIIYNKEYYYFYLKHSNIINTINDSDGLNIFTFFAEVFESNGKYDKFIEYVKVNKDSTSRIEELLTCISLLGINRLVFDPTLDFDLDFSYVPFKPQADFDYLDKPRIIPTYNPYYAYDSEYLKYNGNGSNYVLPLVKKDFTDDVSVTSRYGIIYVNNLLFDPSLLPTELSTKETFDKLIALKNSKKDVFDLIHDEVQLSVGLEDLEDTFKKLEASVSTLKTVEDKTAIKEALKTIASEITKLATYTDDMILESSQDNEDITPDYILEQKNDYIRRREMAKYDID